MLVGLGTKVEIEIFGEGFSAIVQQHGPLWDPENKWVKG